MDKASKLVCELQGKLWELDHKVWQYQRDMASEFNKYEEELLCNVPADVSTIVLSTIAESMKDYKLLNVHAAESIESSPKPRIGTSCGALENGNHGSHGFSELGSGSLQIPFRTQPAAEGEADASPRSPHQREIEFRGVFTPSYLPLLDSTDRNERRSSHQANLELELSPKGKGKGMGMGMGMGKGMDTLLIDASTDTRSLSSTPEPPKLPIPKRRNTDEVSIASDWSDGVTRRSALRRLSSVSNKPSPRRVRFDVEGEEVLPTASPHNPNAYNMAKDIPLDYQSLSDMEEEAGSEQIENIEDIEEPPPKRISSSQRLRALSRSPLVDDGTQWTTVSAPPDGSASVAIAGEIPTSIESSSEDLVMGNGLNMRSAKTRPDAEITGTESSQYPSSSISVTATTQPEQQQQDNSDSSDDDILDILTLRSARNKNPAPTIQSTTSSSTSSSGLDKMSLPNTTTERTNAYPELEGLGKKTSIEDEDRELRFDEEDENEMFRFDENTERVARPGPENSHSGAASPTYAEQDSKPKKSTLSETRYSQTPPRDIARAPDRRNNLSTPSGIAGSFRGHPFSMPIVSPKIHAQAASLGDFQSFVGSVHGRSGLDESNVESFKNSLGGNYGQGTPRSMMERMRFDERMEAEAAERKKNESQKK